MKKLYTIAALLLMAVGLSSCKISVDKDSKKKNLVTKTLEVGDFICLSLRGHGDLILTQDSVISVTVEAPADKIDRVKWENKDGALEFWFDYTDSNDKRKYVLYEKNLDYCIRISAPDIEKILIAGSGDLKIRNFTVNHPLEFAVAGSGDIETGVISATEISAKVAGSGDIELKAKNASLVNLSVAGSGDIDARLDNCADVEAAVAGSGDIELKGTARNLQKTVGGSGDIDDKELRIIR